MRSFFEKFLRKVLERNIKKIWWFCFLLLSLYQRNKQLTIMGRLFNILDNFEYSFEMSDKVKEKKFELMDQLDDLFDEYIGEEILEDIDIKVGEINVVKIIVDVDDVYIVDVNGNKYSFFEDITIKEIKFLLSSVRKIIEEEY